MLWAPLAPSSRSSSSCIVNVQEQCGSSGSLQPAPSVLFDRLVNAGVADDYGNSISTLQLSPTAYLGSFIDLRARTTQLAPALAPIATPAQVKQLNRALGGDVGV